MKNSKAIFLTLTCLLLAMTNTIAGEWRYEKYFVDKDKSTRWKIPSENEAIAGSQNFWFVTPHDVRKGGFNISIKKGGLQDFSDKGFSFTPCSSWADYVYRCVPLKTPGKETGDVPNWPSVTSRSIHWSGIPKVKTSLIFSGKVTTVLPGGKGFEADLELKGGLFPVRFEVVSEKLLARRRLPELHSRQYGPHWLHTFDVYYPKDFKPEKDEPLPVLLNIHGGGWGAFNKVCPDPISWNQAGLAYISISYRYVSMYEQTPAMNLPVAAPLLDAARAIQNIKYNAKELGIDPNRICLTGGSAGGASSAWLAMVDDLAEPDSKDPISRTSSRVAASTPCQAQTSLDPQQMKKWIPQITYGAHAFFDRRKDKAYAKIKKGPERFQYFLDNRDKILTAIQDFSAYGFASKDDPPMLLNYGGQKDLIPSPNGGNATHHPKFGEYLYKRLKELGVPCWYWCDDVKKYGGKYAGWQGDLRFLQDQFMPKKKGNK